MIPVINQFYYKLFLLKNCIFYKFECFILKTTDLSQLKHLQSFHQFSQFIEYFMFLRPEALFALLNNFTSLKTKLDFEKENTKALSVCAVPLK